VERWLMIIACHEVKLFVFLKSIFVAACYLDRL